MIPDKKPKCGKSQQIKKTPTSILSRKIPSTNKGGDMQNAKVPSFSIYKIN